METSTLWKTPPHPSACMVSAEQVAAGPRKDWTREAADSGEPVGAVHMRREGEEEGKETSEGSLSCPHVPLPCPRGAHVSSAPGQRVLAEREPQMTQGRSKC